MVEERILSGGISLLLSVVLPGPLVLGRQPFSWGQGAAVGVKRGSCSPVLVF